MKVTRTPKSSRPANKVHRSYTNRAHKDHVTRLERIPPSTLTKDSNPDGRMISYDMVYEKLKQLKDEYKEFNSEEQLFEDAWANLLDDPENFMEHLVEVLEAHNHVVEALIDFDKIFETNHWASLEKFINDYASKFYKISIVVQPDLKFRIRKRKLRRHMDLHPEYFDFLKKENGFLNKLFAFYHQLKAIQPPVDIEEDQLAWYHGLFMDSKA